MTLRDLPSVSVVVPVFNGEATVGDLLHALLHQSPIPNELEIIVVDNQSTDSTRDVLSRFSGITVVSESRRGPAAARNAGLRVAHHEIILHCDADTLPTRRWIAELSACFRDENVFLAAGKTLSFPPATPPEHYLATAQLYDAEFNINRPVLPFAASMNMGVRRSAAVEAGGWNEEMMTAEDVDFCTRVLAQHPGPIRFAPQAVLFHRNRSSDAGLRKQAWTYGEGVADTYRRYPEVLDWGMKQYLHLVPTVVSRSIAPLWLRAARLMGLADDEKLNQAHYHRMWTWWFWGGFFSFLRYGQTRPMWGSGEQ